MVRRILSIIITLAVVIGTLQVNTNAAETGQEMTPTRTETLELSISQGEENQEEGWKWTADNNGGTLELENCYIKTDEVKALRFVFPDNNNSKTINIILKGNNIIETTSTDYKAMIGSTDKAGSSITYNTLGDYVIKGEGSLDIRTSEPITKPESPYAFGGKSIRIESGNIKSNIGFCFVRKEVNIQGGSMYIDIPSGIGALDGVYGEPINISGGDIYINAPQCAIRSDDGDINITGGNVECGSKESTSGIFSSCNINITGNGETIPNVKVSNKPGTAFSALHSNNISVSGSAVIADSIRNFDSIEESIEKGIVFNGSDGKVYGETELTSCITLPVGSTLSVPEDSVLHIKNGGSLIIPDGALLVNNGIPVSAGNGEEICITGGYIKKEGVFCTNHNKKYSIVTIKDGDNETPNYYSEGSIILLEPG